MARDTILDGVFAINKPMGISSAQVIRDCQAQFNPSTMFAPVLQSELARRVQESNSQRKRRSKAKRPIQVKMGHGGTLDPLATGVLVLGLGSGTKVLNSFLNCTKAYETVVLFGASTDTYDRVGRILTKRPYEGITQAIVEKAMEDFRGTIQQTPPLYSALKMDGKKLYEYAREGLPIPRQIESRAVDVVELELVEWYEPGTHNHHWPIEEAEAFERNFAEQVWRNQKQTANAKKLTAEEEKEDEEALEAHESFKKEFEERQDDLVRDSPFKRQRLVREPPVMSGALGELPPDPMTAKGTNLVPTPPASNTPPPWTDKGPPAAKIRMTVTSGFYVRSFCHDLGMKIGSAAMMAELCRTRQGDFNLGGNDCLEYEDLAKGESVWAPKVQQMLNNWAAKGRAPPPSELSQTSLPSSPRPGDKRKSPDVESSPEGPRSKRRRDSPSANRAIEEEILPRVIVTPTEESEVPTPIALATKAEAMDEDDGEVEWNGIKD